MCLEARLLHWLAFPGSLSDSSRVLNRSTQPMWALTEDVWNNMVDSRSLVGPQHHLLPFSLQGQEVSDFSLLLVHFLPYSLQYQGRSWCILQFYVWKVYLPVGTVCKTCVSEWIVLQVSFQLVVDTLSATFQNNVSDFLELLALLCLMLNSILVKKCVQQFLLVHLACGTSWCKHLFHEFWANFVFQSWFVSSSSDTKVTSRVSHGSYSWVTVNCKLVSLLK